MGAPVAPTAPNPKLGAEIERIVLQRVAEGRLVLPAMPVVAHECLNILRAPDFNMRKLVAQIESEPLLAALVVRAASTAAHGGNAKGLDQAVAHLGTGGLKPLIVEYASRELFKSSDKRIAEANKRIWDHSVAVAHLARDIAAFVNHPDNEACYLGGLLHDVGKPIAAAMLLEAERKLTQHGARWIDPAVWTNTIETIHRKIGIALAVEWHLPDEAAAAIRDCSDYDAANRNTASNIVRLANAVAKREGFATGPVDMDDVEAMCMVGRSLLGAEEELIGRLAARVRERAGIASA